MRKAIVRVLATTALVATVSSAQAATFVWNGGIWVPGVTSPNPLTGDDILSITGGANKTFDGTTFRNEATVNWAGGAIFFANGAVVENAGLWDSQANTSLSAGTGAPGQFVNTGTFRKSGGGGITDVGAVGFTNNGGIIDAQNGTIRFSGNGAVFNAGTIFQGAGSVSVTGSTTFNGAFTANNLSFNSGTQTGNAAALTGAMSFVSGTLAGTWTVNGGSTLAISGGANKIFDGAVITNDGTIDWSGGTLFFANSATINNAGLWIASGNNDSLTDSTGAPGQFVNTGTFRRAGGAGVINVGAVRFTNDGGTIDVQTGTLRFVGGDAVFGDGTVFQGAGVADIATAATFNGAISSTNLLLSAGTFTGGAASLSGSAAWRAGTLTGGWTFGNDATFAIESGANKTVDALTLVNNGTVNWSGGLIFFANGATIANAGLWNAVGDDGIGDGAGAPGQFVNTGIFRKSGGTGVTSIGAVAFTNNGGTIDAQTGIIRFTGGDAVFNAGTVFSGAGTHQVTTNAAFNGAFTAANLELSSGTFTGTGAALSGSASYLSGSLAGGWTVASDGSLAIASGANKTLNALALTNQGEITWSAGALFFANAAEIVNQGIFTATGDNSFLDSTGTIGRFVNTGLLRKTGGAGTTNIGNAVDFSNTGTISVTSGTIALPTNFDNDGTLTGTGTFQLSGTLRNDGVIAPGAGGAGTLTLNGGLFQSATGAMSFEVAATGAADRLIVNGAAALGGLLNLSCIGSCAIGAGDTFTLLTSSGALSGTFAGINTNGFLPGFGFDLSYDYVGRRVLLTVLDPGNPIGAIPEPSSWALMIGGFGLIGAAARRRRGYRLQTHFA